MNTGLNQLGLIFFFFLYVKIYLIYDAFVCLNHHGIVLQYMLGAQPPHHKTKHLYIRHIIGRYRVTTDIYILDLDFIHLYHK